MKNLIITIMSLLTTGFAFGQNVSFPDSNAIWSVYDQKYYVNGDSMIDSLVYDKYYFSNDSALSTDSALTSGDFYALLREDTATKRVYSIPKDSTQERLLYDFSLQENDTVSVYPISYLHYTGPYLIHVISVDSVSIDSTYRKRLKITGGYFSHEYWIEGIGSTTGIFNSGAVGVGMADIYYPKLLCFEQNGDLLYDNPHFTDCYEKYPTGITENQPDKDVKIYPNPVRTSLSIESDQRINSIKIIDLNGRVIKTSTASSHHIQLDMSEVENGIYLVVIDSDRTQTIKRILKNDS